jgi:Mannose-6-phosphate isomerase
VVEQGGRLSLKLHHHRADHWMVVRGGADDDLQMLHENESKCCTRTNQCACRPGRGTVGEPSKIDLGLIEVQSGSYISGNDIERIDTITAARDH